MRVAPRLIQTLSVHVQRISEGAFQGSRITSDAGLILVRELDERLGLARIIAAHMHDSRHGRNTQFRLPDLLRQSVYSRLAGYENLNDAQRLSTDPTVSQTTRQS